MKIMKAALMAILALTAFTAAPANSVSDQNPQIVERWFRRLPYAKQKLTKLNFFIQDNKAGDFQTTVPVAQANMTATSATRFGLIDVMDSPLTVGPEPDARIIGRCQGMLTFASQQEIGLLMTLNLAFTDGPYAGSTLNILGPKRSASFYREYPIIGGTGVFRLARGVAVDNTYQGAVAPGMEAPVQVQVIVSHYSDPKMDRIIEKFAEEIK